MKKYKYPKTKQLIKRLKPFLQSYRLIEDSYYKEISKLEKEIEELISIPDIELFFCDNECVGIGNAERSMELIHWQELER